MATVHYVDVWKLHGANNLVADKSPLELLRIENPALIATVTSEPEPYFLHIDRSAAIGALFFKGFFAPNKAGTIDERFATELETARSSRAKQTERGAFLVLQGETNLLQPDFSHRRDTEEFAACINAIEKSKIREIFRPQAEAILTAISLCLPDNADRRIERIGAVIYLVDTESRKPVYTFSIEAGPIRVSIASPLTGEIVATARRRASKIVDDTRLVRPANLLITSINQATDSLLSFIAAWSGLEIFVNTSFKMIYEPEWFSMLKHGAPVAVAPVFERLNEIMRDKYRLADKFLIVASLLDSNAAESDAGEFLRIKKIRDNLLHGLNTPAHLPTEEVQKLLLKYLTLHLDRVV